VNSGAADSPLPMPTGGGGDAAPADSGADAYVRLAGRTARTRLTLLKYQLFKTCANSAFEKPNGWRINKDYSILFYSTIRYGRVSRDCGVGCFLFDQFNLLCVSVQTNVDSCFYFESGFPDVPAF
jgi:hypothetical protein